MTRFAWLKRRSEEREHLDDPERWAGALSANLAELAWTNRWFGGRGSLVAPLRPLVRLAGARILDVGTGSGETCCELGRWARARGASWSMVGLDRSGLILGLGDDGRLARCVGDARTLPFPDGTFDAVVCLQTLHHFDDADAARVLAEMVRVSRYKVVVSDLKRSLLTYAATLGLATFIWRNDLTRHDGPASVRSGFRSEELRQLGEAGGAAGCQVRHHGPFRLVLEWERRRKGPGDTSETIPAMEAPLERGISRGGP